MTADVFEGTCDARGGFNIDTKAYNVSVMGHDLHSEDATNIPYFRTLVQLDLKMLCDGNSRSTLTYGSFYSGKAFTPSSNSIPSRGLFPTSTNS